MGVSVNFYNNTSDENVLNKTLNYLFSIEGNFKENFDVETPILTIQNDGIVNANYCKVDAFSRYYFITKQEIIRNNVVRLYLTVDVLMTYNTAISNLACDIENSSNDFNDYLSSPFWVSTVKTKTDVLQFDNGFNQNGEYILITAGG